VSTNNPRQGGLKTRLVNALSLLKSAHIQDIVWRYRDDLHRALRSTESVPEADTAAKKVLICLRCCVDRTKVNPDLDWVGDAFNTASCDLQVVLGRDEDWRSQLSLMPLTGLPDRLVEDNSVIFEKLAKELEFESKDLDSDRGTRVGLSVADVTRSGVAERQFVAMRLLTTLSQEDPVSPALVAGGLWGDIGIAASFKQPSQKALAADLVESIHQCLSDSDLSGDDTDSKRA